jgi:hypothetical protein
MVTNLDTKVRYPTGIEILDDADLDAVNGGTGEVHDACVRVALGILFHDAFGKYQEGEMYRNAPCG